MTHTIRYAVAALCLGLMSSPPAHASSGLEFHFGSESGVGRGYLDVGRIAAGQGTRSARETTIRERIRLRLEGGPAAPLSARVWVALTALEPGVRVSVDGVPLDLTPRLIDPVHRVGVDVAHDIEVTVSHDAPAGVLFNDLLWTAEAE